MIRSYSNEEQPSSPQFKKVNRRGDPCTMSTSPIFVLPLAAFYLREDISMRAILGDLCTLAGISLLFAF